MQGSLYICIVKVLSDPLLLCVFTTLSNLTLLTTNLHKYPLITIRDTNFCSIPRVVHHRGLFWVYLKYIHVCVQ